MTRCTAAFAMAALLLTTAGAQAQALKDPQWQSWFDAGHTDELARAATARLATQPDDVQAAGARALSTLDSSDPHQLTLGQETAESCIAQHPDQALCYFALGAVQGKQAWAGGALKAISMAGKIRNNLTRAVNLDPTLYEARLALMQVYMLVPPMLGGSMAKARELAAEAQQRQPEHAKLLRALIDGHDKQWAAMEQELRSVKPADDKALTHQWRETWGEMGYETLHDGDTDKARAAFEKVRKDWPRQALGYYGLGRVSAQLGDNEEAIRLYQQAATLEGADKLQIDHRLGMALINKGDKEEGRKVLERFVASKKANPGNLQDARKRLAELGQGAG